MSEVKIQFGCGGNILEGFQNFDTDVDLERPPLPFPDNHADFILIEHCLEHFNTHQVLFLLDEFRRILKVGGVLRVCVPMLEDLPMDHARDIILSHGHRAAFSRRLLHDMLRSAGFDHSKIYPSPRKEIDGHWKEIGKPKDDLETCRMEAIKT